MRKSFFGKAEGHAYAINLSQLNRNDFPTQLFGHRLDDLKKVKLFKETAKFAYVGCKRKPTLASIKTYIKENNIKEFYAMWEPDSSYHKDDVVTLFYKEVSNVCCV